MLAMDALVSCSPRVVTVEVPRLVHDSLRTSTLRVDSVHVTDSVRINGDTVRMWRTVNHTRILHDTLRAIRTDTIGVPVPIEKIVEVPKTLTWWQRTSMWLGCVVSIGVLIWLLFLYIKRKM